MKCHFIYDKKAGKVLIPGCWSVVNSGEISDCDCGTNEQTFAQFEKQKFNELINEKNKLIKDLERENLRLNNEIKKLLKL